MRRLLLVIAWGLLALSIAGLAFAIATSEHALVGLGAGLLMAIVVAGLAQLARHQRAAIHGIKRDLAHSRVIAEALIDASPDGIVLLEQTRIVACNPAARHLFGASAEAGLAGRELSELIVPDDHERVLDWVRQREAGAVEPERLELRGLTVGGQPLVLEATAARIPLPRGAHLALFLRELSAHPVGETGAAGHVGAPSPTAPDPRGNERLLIVDDDQGALSTYRRLLEQRGYRVELFASPEAALARLREPPPVDLVVLDMVLPGAATTDLVQRIGRRRPGQRILTVSPYPLPEKEEQVLELGAVGIFRKPLDGGRLAAGVRRALDRPPPQTRFDRRGKP